MKRIISSVLAFCMMFSLLSVNAFGAVVPDSEITGEKVAIYGEDAYTVYGGSAQVDFTGKAASGKVIEYYSVYIKPTDPLNRPADPDKWKNPGTLQILEEDPITYEGYPKLLKAGAGAQVVSIADRYEYGGALISKNGAVLRFLVGDVTASTELTLSKVEHTDPDKIGKYAMMATLTDGDTNPNHEKFVLLDNVILSTPTVWLVHGVDIKNGAGGTVNFNYDKKLTIETSGMVNKSEGNGNVTVASGKTGSATMAQKDTATVQIAANAGQTIAKLTVNGTPVADAVGKTSYNLTYKGLDTVSSATAKGTIAVEYSTTLTTAVDGGHGKITYKNQDTTTTATYSDVSNGDKPVVTMTPDADYCIDQFTVVNGTSTITKTYKDITYTNAYDYTFGALNGTASITVKYAVDKNHDHKPDSTQVTFNFITTGTGSASTNTDSTQVIDKDTSGQATPSSVPAHAAVAKYGFVKWTDNQSNTYYTDAEILAKKYSADTTFTAVYGADVDPNDPTQPGEGTADALQVTFTYVADTHGVIKHDGTTVGTAGYKERVNRNPATEAGAASPTFDKITTENANGYQFVGWVVGTDTSATPMTAEQLKSQKFTSDTTLTAVFEYGQPTIVLENSEKEILKGKWTGVATDATLTLTFLVRIGDNPATADQAKSLQIKSEVIGGFTGTVDTYLAVAAADYTSGGTKTYEGKEWRVVTVKVDSVKSGIVSFHGEYPMTGVTSTPKSDSCVVIVPGDVDRSGAINVGDYNRVLRYYTEPNQIEEDGEYSRELADVNVSDSVNLGDANTVLYMYVNPAMSN